MRHEAVEPELGGPRSPDAFTLAARAVLDSHHNDDDVPVPPPCRAPKCIKRAVRPVSTMARRNTPCTTILGEICAVHRRAGFTGIHRALGMQAATGARIDTVKRPSARRARRGRTASGQAKPLETGYGTAGNTSRREHKPTSTHSCPVARILSGQASCAASEGARNSDPIAVQTSNRGTRPW